MLADGPTLLNLFVNEERKAMKRRRIMFTNSPMRALINGISDICPFTKEDIQPYRTMSQQVRFDHVLAYEYLKNLPGLEALNGQDRYVMYKYIFMGFCCLDVGFLSAHTGMAEQGSIVFTDSTYQDLTDATHSTYLQKDDPGAEARAKLYWPLNQRVYDLMILPMAALKLDQVEYAAMKALAMFRCYYELSIPGKLLARQYEIAVVSGLHHYYSGRPDAAERVGQIILFMGNISESYNTVFEFYRKFQIFNLLKIDAFLEEMSRL
ncbi:Protein NHR-20 [Aphelenchoides avenae]|nr:Protein NHR-20 [Aphelenchus avenae]